MLGDDPPDKLTSPLTFPCSPEVAGDEVAGSDDEGATSEADCEPTEAVAVLSLLVVSVDEVADVAESADGVTGAAFAALTFPGSPTVPSGFVVSAVAGGVTASVNVGIDAITVDGVVAGVSVEPDDASTAGAD